MKQKFLEYIWNYVFLETVFHRPFSTELSAAVAVLAWKIFETLCVCLYFM